VILRYSAMVNGLSDIAMTLLDVLSGLETLKVCRAYRCDGAETSRLPADWESVCECTPIYDELPGWSEELTGIRRFDDLPANAKSYVRHVEELAGVPISIVSVGAERGETILRNE
ncbi:MAG: adenylosuccinate synthetase, partial [Armatimonadetes bacterium]|nr:adenylosuccinate synthetase [Armatimonadota bacterium]